MFGLQNHIEYEWTGEERLAKFVWQIQLANTDIDLRITYGIGRYDIFHSAALQVSPYTGGDESYILIAETADDFAYLGVGFNRRVDPTVWPEVGQVPTAAGAVGNDDFRQYGYEFAAQTTGSPLSSTNIDLSIKQYDSNTCIITVNGLSATISLLPSVATLQWNSYFPDTGDRLGGQSTSPLIYSNVPRSCTLSILNQMNKWVDNIGDIPTGDDFYYRKYFTVSSVTWDVYTPTDDTAFLAYINADYTWPYPSEMPTAYRTCYWWSEVAYTPPYYRQDVVDSDYGFIYVTSDNGISGGWSFQYVFQPINSGKYAYTLPTGEYVVPRKVNTTNQYSINHFKKTRDGVFSSIATTTSTYNGQADRWITLPDVTLWDGYGFDPDYYTVGNSHLPICRQVKEFCFTKMMPSGYAVAAYRNRWESGTYIQVTDIPYSSYYTEIASKQVEQQRSWVDPPWGTLATSIIPPLTDWYMDERYDQGACGFTKYPDILTDDEAIIFWDYQGGVHTVATEPRETKDDAHLPYPWLRQLEDGTWLVSWFADGYIYCYKSLDNLGNGFSQYYSASVPGIEYVHSVQAYKLTNGAEYIIGIYTEEGYPYTGKLMAWYKDSATGTIAGPYINMNITGIPAFYMLEFVDGMFEVGVYDYSLEVFQQWRTYNIKQDITSWDEFPGD